MTFSAGNRGSYKWGIKTIDNSFFYSNIFDEYVNQIEFVLLVNSSQADSILAFGFNGFVDATIKISNKYI
jgi:hypothetical protein